MEAFFLTSYFTRIVEANTPWGGGGGRSAFEDGDAAFAYTPWVSDAEAKDDFTPEKAAFALRNNGTKFYDYVAQPQGQETLHKLLNGVAPWLNVSSAYIYMPKRER